MRIRDWSSDVCSSDLLRTRLESSERDLVRYAAANDIVRLETAGTGKTQAGPGMQTLASVNLQSMNNALAMATADRVAAEAALNAARARGISEGALNNLRSEEHTSELQSLMRISYADFCLNKK